MLKSCFKFPEVIIRAGIGKPFSIFPEGIYLNKLLGDLLYGVFSLLLGQIPRSASQPIKLWILFIGTNILLQNTNAISRNVESIVSGIFNVHKIIDLLFDIHFGKASVTGYILSVQSPFYCSFPSLGPCSLRTKDFILTNNTDAQLGPGKAL